MFPMKYFEYAASGIMVVSTPLKFTIESQCAYLNAGPKEMFPNMLESQILRKKLNINEAHFAVGKNTWKSRLNEMLAVISGLHIK